jgi:hypothetical protein
MAARRTAASSVWNVESTRVRAPRAGATGGCSRRPPRRESPSCDPKCSRRFLRLGASRYLTRRPSHAAPNRCNAPAYISRPVLLAARHRRWRSATAPHRRGQGRSLATGAGHFAVPDVGAPATPRLGIVSSLGQLADRAQRAQPCVRVRRARPAVDHASGLVRRHVRAVATHVFHERSRPFEERVHGRMLARRPSSALRCYYPTLGAVRAACT